MAPSLTLVSDCTDDVWSDQALCEGVWSLTVRIESSPYLRRSTIQLSKTTSITDVEKILDARYGETTDINSATKKS